MTDDRYKKSVRGETYYIILFYTPL